MRNRAHDPSATPLPSAVFSPPVRYRVHNREDALGARRSAEKSPFQRAPRRERAGMRRKMFLNKKHKML